MTGRAKQRNLNNLEKVQVTFRNRETNEVTARRVTCVSIGPNGKIKLQKPESTELMSDTGLYGGVPETNQRNACQNIQPKSLPQEQHGQTFSDMDGDKTEFGSWYDMGDDSNWYWLP